MQPALVLDNGSSSIKCGFSGDNFPSLVVPTVVDRRQWSDGTVNLTCCTGNAEVSDGTEMAHRSRHVDVNQLEGSIDSRQKKVGREQIHCCGRDAGTHFNHSAVHRGESGAPRESEEPEKCLLHPVRNTLITDMEAMQLLWDSILLSGCLHPHWQARNGSRPGPPAEESSDDNAVAAARDGEDVACDCLPSQSLLLPEAPLLDMPRREKIFELMFERYRFARIQSVHQGVLALFSAGLETGVAVECGEHLLHCMPVFEGCPLTGAYRQVTVGGRDVTNYLARLLQTRGAMHRRDVSLASFRAPAHASSSSSHTPVRHQQHPQKRCGSNGNGPDWIELVQTIKERFCYAAVDTALDVQLARDTTALERSFLLPDGSRCTLAAERFQATEVLFTPALMDVESDGLSDQLWNAIQAADIDIRPHLYAHLVLSGGSSLFPGLSTRVQSDMDALYLARNLKGDRSRWRSTNCTPQVEDGPRRRYAVLTGGCALAHATLDLSERWLSRVEWEEGGGAAILRARYSAA